MFSKACEYGIKATILIVKQSLEGKRTNVNEVSAEIGSPVSFTAKILQKLVKTKIIYSTKGASGGFEIDLSSINSLTLLNIIIAIDGDSLLNNCILGLNNCSTSNPCPMHHKYSKIRTNMVDTFNTTSIVELANLLNIKKGVLKN